MKISGLFVYPLKSGSGQPVPESEVVPTGLKHDRTLAVVDANHQILTGRDHPRLLGITATVDGTTLTLKAPSSASLTVEMSDGDELMRDIRLFKNQVEGVVLNSESEAWMSDLLGIPSRLVAMMDHPRSLLPRHGGKDGDVVSFADASPVHLLSEASLEDLNSRLPEPVTIQHFRPNLLVSGCQPYEEDKWKQVRINDCLFDVHLHCPRCVFTTIDPVTHRKSPQQEPLRTLSRYRKTDGGAVTFGVYLVPRQLGRVALNDPVSVVNAD